MIDLDLHIGWFILGGFALLAMSTLPQRFENRPLSLPILYIAAGFVAFELLDPLVGPRPITSSRDSVIVEYGTELIVIVSLAGAGLKLDRAFGLVSWASVWRLLALAMPLTVAVAIILGGTTLGLGLGSAILLGAVLAPTDPVLAEDVQVARPGGDDESEVRFTLTAEAGLNDGLAFPIAHLAVAVAAVGGSFGAVAFDWLTTDVAYRVVVGALAGVVLGKAIVWFSERSAGDDGDRPLAGVFLLGATIVVYGLTELVNGYGFLAVFVAARSRGSDDFRRRVSRFADEIERMLLSFVLLGFGALLSEGILDGLTWRGALVSLVLVLVIRPVAGFVALTGSPLPRAERAAVAFFGIRGMGSLYYLAWASNHGDFASDQLATLWAVTSATVVISVVIHGVTASPVMRWVDHRCGRSPTVVPAVEVPVDGKARRPVL